MTNRKAGRRKKEEGDPFEDPCTRITVPMPLLMRQAIRDREKLSRQAATAVIQGILLTALRVEMELIRREQERKKEALK